MNWSTLSDPNTNLKFHAFLLGLALLNARFGFAMMSIPLVAWVAARWIVMGASWLKRRAAEQAVGEWNGRYYAFDGRQVRFYWDAKRTWVDADDLFCVANRRPDGALRERVRLRLGNESFREPPGVGRLCFSDEGAVEYLKGLSDEGAWKVRRWLEREVLPNIVRLRDMQSESYRAFRLDEPDV